MRRFVRSGRRNRGARLSIRDFIRQRWHPLHQVRKIPIIRRFVLSVDFGIWIRIHGIGWPVRVRLLRNISYVLDRRGPEPSIAATLLSVVDLLEPRTFWDVGAHVGYYGFLLKSRDPELQVRMYEPDVLNVALLRTTTQRCGATGLVVIPAAVSRAPGHAQFTTDPTTGATGTLEPAGQAFGVVHFGAPPVLVEVAVTSLDEERRGSERIDLIKIDVEGHEEEVFAGGLNLISKDQPVLLFECFHRGSWIVEQLATMGYQILDGERRTFDLEGCTNFLAVPRAHSSRLLDLISAANHVEVTR